MAGKISELTDLGTTPADGDYFEVLDTDANDNKKVLYSDLIAGASGGTGAGANKILLETIDNSAAAGSFDFSGIDQTYDKLVIEGWLRGDVAAVSEDAYLYINGDTTDANYHRQNNIGDNGGANVAEASNPLIALVSAGSSPASSYTYIRVELENYTGSTLKAAQSQYLSYLDSDRLWQGSGAVVSAITDPVTSLSVVTNNDPTDELFGVLRLYGEKSITVEDSETITVKKSVPVTLSGGEFDIDLTDYQYGDRLVIEGTIAGDVTATNETVYAFLNTDLTLANYHRQALVGDNNGSNFVEASNPTVALVPAASSPSNAVSKFRLELEDYASASGLKQMKSDFMSNLSAGRIFHGSYAVVSSLTAAITRIRIRTDNFGVDNLTGTLKAYIEKEGVLPTTGYTQSIVLDVGDESTALTTGTAKKTFRMPYAFTLTDVRASVTTAPTDAALQVDINEGGVSVLSTVLSIDSGEKTSTTAATPAVISDTALADDAEITIDIDQIGSTVAGAGLKVTLIGNR